MLTESTANFRGSSSDLEGQNDESDYAAGKSKVVPAYSGQETSVAALFQMGGVIALIGAFLFYRSSPSSAPIIFVFTLCCEGLIFSYWLARSVLSKDDGTAAMRAVSDAIREGAEGFLAVQYRQILKMGVITAVLIALSYQMRPTDSTMGVSKLGNGTLGFLAAFGFVIGFLSSSAAGYLSMLIASRTNVRVTSAARRSYGEALVICFRGGAFSAILDITLCVFGETTLYCVLQFMYGHIVKETDIPILMVGYGFGASFVALFMQLGGGIYTKAADVGADLVGKVESGIPEDDPRNPAVIADLVGDMVGDCVGSSADVFESVAAEIIGTMILASTLAVELKLENPVGFMLYPLVIHALDIVVSSCGVAVVSLPSSSDPNPMTQLNKGYRVSLVLAMCGFVISTRWLLNEPSAPNAWQHFAGCGFVGICTAFVYIKNSEYFTDYAHPPVRAIAEASTTGHGTNIIVGTAYGMKSTVVPTLAVSIAVVVSYHLGRTSGLGAGHNAGLFGTAVATMGMLSSAAFVLSMNNYGPIADNAGGIAEMSQQPEHVRDSCDKLDAAGNVTKAVTKGYSIGSASMACFLLFGAFMDDFSQFSGKPFHTVDIAIPEVLIGGLIGTMMIYWFTGLAIAAVGKAAHVVVNEVRRQWRERPGIMEYKEKPDHQRCVSIVTKAALAEMTFPGCLCIFMPVATGLVGRFIGEATGRPMLGAEVLAGYLMFGTVSGIMMALFLDNVGGAWDNAKKYVELGNFGGKNSEAHKAAITGDTVGDPFKDTAGPSLHVVIKLLSTTILVLGPLFIKVQH